MGNSPSSSRPATSQQQFSSASSSQSQQSQNEGSRPVRRDTKHPIPVHNQRVAAPPEPSLAAVQGTIPNIPSHNLPRSFPPRAVASLNNSSSSSSPQGRSSMTAPRAVGVGAQSSSSRASHDHNELLYDDDDINNKDGGDYSIKHGKNDDYDDDMRREPAKPVDVPNCPASPSSPRSIFPDNLETPAALHSSVQDMSYLTRPPRLPLPIEEEVHTPGSPIIAPADDDDDIDDDDEPEPLDDISSNNNNNNNIIFDADGLPRRSSALSSTTDEDEDVEELRVDRTRPTVPTRLEWMRGGEKVYVTGTIFQWNRKTRLHPVPGRPGVFAATINILPGTHHIRFLVDGQMQTSPDLPTTVDFGNNLVNYIEVNPDDVPAGPSEKSGAAPAKEAPQAVLTKPSPPSMVKEAKTPVPRVAPAADQFSSAIPSYLLDFDQPEDTQLYQTAASTIERLPNPPSLPGFLAKPILNAATLIKDDNSVLNMPNHTVLNHLGTCSIKNNILAVSATTRYKDKYVTTIIYKPTSSEGS